MTYLEAIVIAVVEGLSEFLPISSTGHMMIASGILGIAPTPFVKLFTVAIQFGAILSVIVMYFKRFFKSFKFYIKLAVAFVPAAIAGVLLGDWIDAALENLMGVAIALFVGGVILLFVDQWFKRPKIKEESEIDLIRALKIGAFQCLALFPGVSRSGATIIGGMANGLSRQVAAEFSFFLAVPTMFAATAKKLYDFNKVGISLTGEELKLLALGNIVAFVVAMVAIKTFIGLLNKYGFKIWGIYRIIIGGILLILFLSGHQLTVL